MPLRLAISLPSAAATGRVAAARSRGPAAAHAGPSRAHLAAPHRVAAMRSPLSNPGQAGRRAVLRTGMSEDDIAAATAAAEAATAVPKQISQEDMNKFYRIVSHPSWDDVQQEVVTLMKEGELTEGILEAAFMVMEKSKAEGESEEVLSSIANVTQLILAALSQQNASPAVKLVDEVSQMLTAGAEQTEAEARLKEALAEGGELTKDSFLQEMDQLFVAADRQDLAFYAQAEEWKKTASADELKQMEEMEGMRKSARASMQAVRDMAAAL